MSDFFKQENGKASASFGYRYVDEGEKPPLVRDLFSKVAPRYDIMNDVMSLGLHRFWKDKMVDALFSYHNRHLLDIAGGTGDIAFRFLAKGGKKVTLCDLTPEMMLKGRARAKAEKWQDHINWVAGDGEKLPFASQSFDCVTVAFGLRNMTHIDRVLNEASRVLKTGGRFLCLEFSQPHAKLFSQLYDLWSFRVIPVLGRQISDNEEAYRYLVESIRRFPHAEKLCEEMRHAGLARVSYKLLAGGVAALHSAWRF